MRIMHKVEKSSLILCHRMKQTVNMRGLRMIIIDGSKDQSKQIEENDSAARFMKRKPILARLIIFAIIIILSSLYLGYAWNRHQNEASSYAVALANSIESVMPQKHMNTLSGNADDLNKPEYEMIKNHLIGLVETTNPIRFAYLMAERGEDIVILIDSEPPESSDYSAPGQVYEEADDVIRKSFGTGETVFTKPTTDRRGISVFVPVKDSATGNVIAVFGMDYSAQEWYAQLWKHMIPDIIVIICIVMLSFALLYGRIQYDNTKTLSRKLAYDEALYRSVFDQAPIGIAIVKDKNFIYKADFVLTSINPMFEKILGRKSSDLANIKWPEITHAEDLQTDLDKFEQFKKGEINGYTMEKRFIKPDGSVVWTLMIISRLSGLYDDHSIHLCLIEDITSQKAAESALVANEKKYRSIAENMTDVVWQADLNMKTTYVSPSVEKLLGESPEEHMKKEPAEKIPEQALYRIHSLLVEETEKEKDPQTDKNRSRTIEVEHYKADGTAIWLEMSISFIRDEKGSAIGLQGVSRDITQRKLAETALKENERRESVLLSHLPGLAYRCKYNRDGIMLFVSDGCYKLTGYLPECLLTTGICRLMT